MLSQLDILDRSPYRKGARKWIEDLFWEGDPLRLPGGSWRVGHAPA